MKELLNMHTSLNFRKIAATFLAMVMCLVLLVGCGEEVPVEPGPKDVIYKSTLFTPKGESYSYLSGVAFYDNMVNMLVSETVASDNSTLENSYLIKTDLSGKVIEKILLSSATEEQAEVSFYSGINITEDGEIYLVRMTDENTNSDESVTKTEIVHRDGKDEIVLVDVSGKLAEAGVDTSNLYVSNFAVDKNKVAYVTVGMDAVWAFDLSKGELLFDNKPLLQGDTLKGLYKNLKGEICAVTFGTIEENGVAADKLILTPINAKSNKYGKSESIDAPGGSKSNIAEGDDKYEYYGYGLSTIYGYKDGVGTLVADLPASGVVLNEITRIIPVSDTQFLLTGYTGDKVGIEKLFILTKVAPEDVPDKSIIMVAAINEPRYVPDYIAEFTASHPQYQVELKLYAKDSSTSYEDGLRAFNTDIIAGNVPDVLIIGERMTYGSYVRKGLFADLYPLMDKDPEISRDDFLEPILKALETDGKLYSIAPAFYVQTLIGKTSIFGEKTGQSIEELEAAAAKIEGAKLFGNMNRNDFVDVFLTKMGRRFLDEDKGVCDFDSPEFISLLEYSKTLPPPAPDAEPYQEWAWSADETGDYKNDRVLIENMEFFVFRWILGVEKMDFGEPITFLGYPNSTGGSGIKAGMRLESAIMSKAKNPDGAWEFVKGLQSYGDPFIESCGYPPLWYFPTLVSELDIAAKNATIPAFQYDTFTGERIPRGTWYGTDLSDLPNNTEGDNAKMYALFDSIDGIHRENAAIMDIIKEETAAYFSSDKSAEETAAIIQDRATTYLEEQK
jgi:ABC-type glycerol-3-phosphate transport system substrate-binding protein